MANENLVDVLSADCPTCGAYAGQVCTEMEGEKGCCQNVPQGVVEHFPSEVHRERFLAVVRAISVVDRLAAVPTEVIE